MPARPSLLGELLDALDPELTKLAALRATVADLQAHGPDQTQCVRSRNRLPVPVAQQDSAAARP